MMKDILVSFFICLVAGSFINANNAAHKATPTPSSTTESATLTDSTPASTELAPIAETSDADFQKDVLSETDQPVLVDFCNSWNGPSQQMVAIMDQLAEDYKGKVKVISLDVDMNPMTKAKYDVTECPTFLIFKEGKQVARFSGAHDKEGMATEIEKIL